MEYNIYDLGLNRWLNKSELTVFSDTSIDTSAGGSVTSSLTSGLSSGLSGPLDSVVAASDIEDGEMTALATIVKKTFTDTASGKIEGFDTDGKYKWLIGDASSSVDWNVTTANTLTVKGAITATTGAIGGFTIGTDYIVDAGNSFGLASTVSGVNDLRFWAGSTFANRDIAPFRVYENGYFTAEYGSLNAGLTLGNGSDKSGTITMNLADTYGDVYIAGGTVNTTAWTATNGFILGIDDSDSNKEKFYIGSASSALDWNVTTVDTLTVHGVVNATAGYIGASTAAIFESTGINLGTTGHVRGGQTGYNTGTGFFLGYDTSTYKFSIGDSTDPSNLLLWTGTQLIVNGTPLSSQDVFGDGSDGDVTINSGAFSSGPITTNALTRDAFFDDLTLSGGNLDCAGYRLFVKGTLTINNGCKVHRNGNNGGNGGNASGVTAGSAGSAGATLADGSVKGGTAGVAGLVGATGLTRTSSDGTNGNAGIVGTSVAKILGAVGAAGGASGDAGKGGDDNPGGSGQTGGAAGSGTGTVYNKPYNSMAAYLLYDFLPSGDNLKSSAGSGSGAGGASGGALGALSNVKSGGGGGGGGSGSAGGIISVFAKTLVNNGTIESKGGTGGNGGNGGNGDQNSQTSWAAGGGGGGGGGAGGSGGVIIIVYSTKSGAGSTSVVGGSGGTKGTGGTGTSGGAYVGQSTDGSDGSDGTGGNAGTLIELTV